MSPAWLDTAKGPPLDQATGQAARLSADIRTLTRPTPMDLRLVL